MVKLTVKKKIPMKQLLQKVNLIELLIFVFSVGGTFFVSSLNGATQLIGFWCWMVASAIGIFFFYKRGMYILMTQFIIYLIITTRTIALRM